MNHNPLYVFHLRIWKKFPNAKTHPRFVVLTHRLVEKYVRFKICCFQLVSVVALEIVSISSVFDNWQKPHVKLSQNLVKFKHKKSFSELEEKKVGMSVYFHIVGKLKYETVFLDKIYALFFILFL